MVFIPGWVRHSVALFSYSGVGHWLPICNVLCVKEDSTLFSSSKPFHYGLTQWPLFTARYMNRNTVQAACVGQHHTFTPCLNINFLIALATIKTNSINNQCHSSLLFVRPMWEEPLQKAFRAEQNDGQDLIFAFVGGKVSSYLFRLLHLFRLKYWIITVRIKPKCKVPLLSEGRFFYFIFYFPREDLNCQQTQRRWFPDT